MFCAIQPQPWLALEVGRGAEQRYMPIKVNGKLSNGLQTQPTEKESAFLRDAR